MSDERIKFQMPDGTSFELDRDTSKQIFTLARAKKMSPHAFVRELFKKGYDAIFAKNN